MKRRLIAVIVLLFTVASCVSAPETQIALVVTETPTARPTSTVTPALTLTSTLTPTSTSTATPTVVPTLSVAGLEGVTQPQPENILEGVVSFSPKLHSKYTNDDFVIGFDKDNHPLVIAIHNADRNNWEWKREIGLRDLARQAGIRIGIDFQKELMEDSKYIDTVNRNFDEVILAQGLYWRWYESKQGELEPYNLSDIERQLAAFKQLDDIVIRGQHLIFAQNNPEWLASGNFTRDELIAILRDHVTSQELRKPEQLFVNTAMVDRIGVY